MLPSNDNPVLGQKIKTLDEIELSKWITLPPSEDELRRAREKWQQYASRKRLFDAEPKRDYGAR